MPKILKRPQAEADLDEIWLYIARDDMDSADRFLEKVEEACQTLADFPYMGVGREELLPALRSLAIGKYVVFYLPINDGVEIVRVLQGMRNIESIF